MHPGLNASPMRMPPAVALGYVVLYLLLDWVSYIHPMRGTNITAWNPQAALAVALVAWNPRCWWLVAGSLSAGALARSLPALNSADLVASLTQTVGYVSIGAAFRRWLNPVPSLATRKEYLVFLLIIGTGAALNATLYAGTLTLFNQASPQYLLQAISRGLIGEIVSQVVTLPVLFALVDRVRRAETFAMVATVEWWVVAAAAMIGAYVVFGRATEDQFKFFYLLLLPVAWGAARFGYVGAAWSALLVQLLLILAVQSAAYLPLTVFELHMLMAVLGAAGLLLGTTVDERERAEQALRASLHIAAAGDMAAALAHELNQPLTALRAYARASQLLAQRLAPPDAQSGASLADVTARIVEEANRAGDVVKRLRDFFRQRGTELKRADIGPLLEKVCRSQAMRAEAAQVVLECHCDDGLPRIWMDPVQIEVVLRNLVSNGVDAALSTPSSDPYVRVHASVEHEHLVIEVLDSGDGIAPVDLPHMFETRRSSKPGGMGIGLLISRSIVEAHEGRLWAEPGPGGKFFVSLPLSEHGHD